MNSWQILATLIIAGPLLAAEERPTVVRVVDSSSDRVPQITVAPNYPRKARRDRIEGQVQVCFDIDRSGRTRRVSVRNSTNRAFEKPSIDAVRASSFRPIEDEDTLQAMKFCRTFIFSLEPAIAEDVNPSGLL